MQKPTPISQQNHESQYSLPRKNKEKGIHSAALTAMRVELKCHYQCYPCAVHMVLTTVTHYNRYALGVESK